MDTPTPLQAHLLKAVQNLAYDSQQLLERAHHAGHTSPPPEVVEQVRIGQRSRDQCEAVALAVGYRSRGSTTRAPPGNAAPAGSPDKPSSVPGRSSGPR
ncbi:hypothetical protein LTT66_12000 [Nocardia gipuzkoensis]|uniref:hypothetical protein n=1 Tax=Nocardia TaxID=1817 RepID=UPI001E477F95|nr:MULTISPECIES: hypothetical protein [Nocardia]UGT70823.1 hypothetical protein LTT66_12000 [Nocardia gipuzkoensis]